MPTERERKYYRMGFMDGQESVTGRFAGAPHKVPTFDYSEAIYTGKARKPKRKLSAWQKYIKNPRNHIKFRDGKLNLKKMGVQYRKKRRR